MNKRILLLILFTFTLSATIVSAKLISKENEYKVIKVIDGDTVYIDFNNNNISEQNEKVRINGIDTFETKPSIFLDYQIQNHNLTKEEALGLGYF